MSPPTKQNKKNQWVSNDTELLRLKRNIAKKSFINNKNTQTYSILKEAQKNLEESYKEDKNNFLNKMCADLTIAGLNNDIGEVFNNINKINGNYKQNTATHIKKLDGQYPKNDEELMSEWKTYFNDLLNNKETQKEIVIDEAQTDLPINCNDFTVDEIYTVIKSLKNKKAPGIDSAITVEALKYSGSPSINILCDIFNDVLNNNKPPEQWKTNIIIPIPKKGDKTNIHNSGEKHLSPNVNISKNI